MMRFSAQLLLSFLLLVSSVSTLVRGDYAHSPFTATTSFDSTPYGPNDGDCQQENQLDQFDWLAPTLFNGASPDGNQCGMCYLVYGPAGPNVTQILRVIDFCSPPACTDDFTFSQPAYQAIGCKGGTCTVTMQVVNCDVSIRYGGKIALYFDVNNGGGYLSVNPLNILVRVEQMDLIYQGTTYSLDHSDPYLGWARGWANSKVQINGPFNLTMTSTEGETLYFSFPSQPFNETIITNAQFTLGYGQGSSSSCKLSSSMWEMMNWLRSLFYYY
jgi:hypothetical protein